MELLGSPSSPFVRKCRVVALETGQGDELKVTFLPLTPVEPNTTVTQNNPIGKIPVLVLNDGTSLFDSRVIAEYLDAANSGPKLFPEAGPARWKALRLQAIGDAIMDAGVLARFDMLVRPQEYRWPVFSENLLAKISQSVEVLETEAPTLGDEMTIGTIAVACGLGYLDFRYTGIIDWRKDAAALATWFETFAARESMKATEHYAPA